MRPRPPPPFLCHKVYLQQKGAKIEQSGGREEELEREREGREAGTQLAVAELRKGSGPGQARPLAMLRAARAEVGARPRGWH